MYNYSWLHSPFFSCSGIPITAADVEAKLVLVSLLAAAVAAAAAAAVVGTITGGVTTPTGVPAMVESMGMIAPVPG